MTSFKKQFPFWFAIILLLINLIVWGAVSGAAPSGELKVSFLNIGQGDAILIKSPNGNELLIDGGPNKGVLRELGKQMPFYDRKIEALLATHPDQDHIAGLPAVLKRYRVDLILEPGVSSPTAVYQELGKQVVKSGAKQVLARRGMIVNFGDGAYFHILFPDRDPAGMDTNDASIVGRLVYGETSFMLTGDSPIKIEKYLVQKDGPSLDSDVLKVGHHGSRTSSGEDFVVAVSPSFAVVSAGRDNSYGHPHQEVLDILNKFGTKILSTFDSGTVTFISDGENIKVE